MKIVYIGTGDELGEVLIERMEQEGNEIYLLSDQALSRKPKSALGYHFYRRPRKGENFQKLLRSVSPDCIIFAGYHYIGDICGDESDADITLLSRTLRTTAEFPRVKFILLSSTEVYGNTPGKTDESRERAAVSERGVHFSREEQLLDIYRKRHGMNAVILRVSQIYTSRPQEGGNDFLSRSFSAIVSQTKERLPGGVFQPLHVSDLVDAVKRAMGEEKQHIYNVCGTSRISAERLYQLIRQQEKLPEQELRLENPENVSLADNTLIKQELGWSDFRDLETLLQQGEITYERPEVKKRRERSRVIPAGVRQLVENLVIFAAFFTLHSLCRSHSLFSRIDWLLIYVILISVSYSTYQGILAAILASCAYLYGQRLSILEMNNFQSYAGSVLAVMEFMFLGFIVSYTIGMLREETRGVRLDLKLLGEEYEDLKAVNEENVLIKNEYEKRLLTSKSGFPKLYSLVNRLMVQEPDRILMETMQVVSELVHTDTVAVYQCQAGTPWLRLVGALNNRSAMDGKTWNLSGFPRIYDAVMRGELCQGEIGRQEPAMVLPILCHGVPEAVILIRTLPFECETLYHVNLLRTLSLLLRDTMEKALQYEELSRKERYVEGTEVLKPEAFRKRIRLAEEKAQKSLAEYCVVEFGYPGSLTEAAGTIGQVIRVTDCLGTNEEGRLFALLNNTAPGNLEYLQKRLLACGVSIHSVSDRPEAV